MEGELLLNLFGNVGVPAAICFYTLHGVKDTLDKLTSAINNLNENHTKEIAEMKAQIQELRYQVAFIKTNSEVNHNERR